MVTITLTYYILTIYFANVFNCFVKLISTPLLPMPQDFREKNTDHMRPDIVALLRSSERSFLRQLIGADPVAVFRWGILRATIRSLAAFNEAGRRWITKHPGTVRQAERVTQDPGTVHNRYI